MGVGAGLGQGSRFRSRLVLGLGLGLGQGLLEQAHLLALASGLTGEGAGVVFLGSLPREYSWRPPRDDQPERGFSAREE